MKKTYGYFIAGTDTGVGKTHATAALVAALLAHGVAALPAKPVQTGAPGSRSPDLDFILAKTGLHLEPALYARLAPCCLPLPASPDLAARQAGVRISARQLARPIVRLIQGGAFPVVEGAGGLMVPLNARETMLDLMQAIGLPVILVARPGLGTLNHTLLSAHALDSAGLPLAAVVLSRSGPWGTLEKDNQATLAQRFNCPVLALPNLHHATRAGLVKAGRKILAALDHAP